MNKEKEEVKKPTLEVVQNKPVKKETVQTSKEYGKKVTVISIER